VITVGYVRYDKKGGIKLERYFLHSAPLCPGTLVLGKACQPKVCLSKACQSGQALTWLFSSVGVLITFAYVYLANRKRSETWELKNVVAQLAPSHLVVFWVKAYFGRGSTSWAS